MGKGSSSNSSNTTENIYGNTTTKNPFFTSKTDSKGNTTTKFTGNNAKLYNNLQSSLNNALYNVNNPNLNDSVTQAFIRQKTNNLNDQSRQFMQNKIMTPLIESNMLRSSEANNMYNNMYNQNAKLISDYNDQALQDAYNRNLNLYNDFMNQYMNLYQGVNSNQNTSLNASSGNKTTKTNSNTKVG